MSKLWDNLLKKRKIVEEDAVSPENAWECFCQELKDVDLPNIKEMCDVLHSIKEDNHRLVLLTHDDPDGILSGVIANASLSELGFNSVERFDGINFYIDWQDERAIDRFHKAIDNLNSKYSNAGADDRYLMLCDINLPNKKAVDALAENWSLLIMDHHVTNEEAAKALSSCGAVCVNPYDPNNDFPYPVEQQALCCAAVLWNVLDHYAKQFCDEEKQNQIKRLQVFAGIATIADRITLSHLSRQIVRESIRICREEIYGTGTTEQIKKISGTENYNTAFYGLFFLLRELAVQPDENNRIRRKIRTNEDIDESLFRSGLAPILHAENYMAESEDSERNATASVTKLYDIFFWDTSEEGKNPVLEIRALLAEKRGLQEFDTEQDLMECRPLKEGPDNYIWLAGSETPVSTSPLANKQLSKLQQERYFHPAHPVFVLQEKDNTFQGTMRAPEGCNAMSKIKSKFPGTINCDGHENAASVTVIIPEEVDPYSEKDKSDYLNGINEQLKEAFSEDLSVAKPAFALSLTENGCGTLYDSLDCEESTRIGDENADPSLLIEFAKQANQSAPYGAGFQFPEIAIYLNLSDEEWDNLCLQTTDKTRENERAKTPLRYSRSIGDERIDITWYGQEIKYGGETLGQNRPILFFGKLTYRDPKLQLVSNSPIWIP